MKTLLLLLITIILFRVLPAAQDFIAASESPGSFPLVSGRGAATICTDKKDHWLVQKAAALLQQDIEQVTGFRPSLTDRVPAKSRFAVIIGSIDQSDIIQKLAAAGKLHLQKIAGHWESFGLETVAHPLPGIDAALVIAGADRRGTVFGIFELSRRIGISPWYWWADVPLKKKKSIFIKPGIYRYPSPGVKYRGIFINDEAPAFSGWAKEKFGGINHLVYEKIFELLLRLKANYLWPAMWANAFNDDDPLNSILADKWGIVMGTSHHEPMLRAQQEWKRYGNGEWNYAVNEAVLRAFWKKGIQNMGRHESIITVGMRGDGDKPMTQGTATALLEKIVTDQRTIIADVTHKPAAQTPQLWALYKEVQDYYDQGMRVPDDITLLLCDDNWGNLRRLPPLNAPPRKGGYGIYYHFDYVGGPRNYKWLNTNNIARVWEQLHLAWEYKARRIWIVNAGDLKPMEFPISFFMDYAWNPGKIQAGDLSRYTTRWCAEQFGSKYAAAIADIINTYMRYSARCKPELLGPGTYSMEKWDSTGSCPSEFKQVTGDYMNLLKKAEQTGKMLSPGYRDAYFELVLHPVKAASNLYNLYYAAALNRMYAGEKNWTDAQQAAGQAKQYFLKDSLITAEYHHTAHGKWNHMMDQTHIGYTGWQQPPVNVMPALSYIPADSAGESAPALSAPQKLHYRKNKHSPEDPAFYEINGHISIEATHYTNLTGGNQLQWKTIPGIGRTGDGLTVFPVTAASRLPGGKSPHAAYQLCLSDSGIVHIDAYFSPTLNLFHQPEGLRYAISIDDEQPQIISINKDDNNLKTWEHWVSHDIIIKTTTHTLQRPGRHTLRYWMVDPAVVLQKLIIYRTSPIPSYLGPPETYKNE